MESNVHAGHRERLKKRFLNHGLENFSDVEVIELLLFYAIPRRNTNELSHALLSRFKDLRGVLDAELDELMTVPGIGENAAVLLKLVTEVNSRYGLAGNEKGTRIRSSAEAGAFLLPWFSYCKEENSVLLCMDTVGHVINCHRLAEGSPGTVDFAPRDMVQLVLRDRAAQVILAHNHLSGVALPSGTDVESTARIYQMLRMMDVELVDHIIVSGGDFVSMRESGFFQQF